MVASYVAMFNLIFINIYKMALTCDYCKKQVKRLVKLLDIPDLRNVFERLEDHNSVCVICTKKAKIVANKIPKRVVDEIFQKKQKLREAKLQAKRTKLEVNSADQVQNTNEAISVDKSLNQAQNLVNCVNNSYGIVLTDAFSISKNAFENMCNNADPRNSELNINCKREYLSQELNESSDRNNLEKDILNSNRQSNPCFDIDEDVKDPSILINNPDIDLKESTLTIIRPEIHVDFNSLCINSSVLSNINKIEVQENDVIEENKNNVLPSLSNQATIVTKTKENYLVDEKDCGISSNSQKENPDAKDIPTNITNTISRGQHNIFNKNKVKLKAKDLNELQKDILDLTIISDDLCNEIPTDLKEYPNKTQISSNEVLHNSIIKSKSVKNIIETISSDEKNILSKKTHHSELNNNKIKHNPKRTQSIKRKCINVSENDIEELYDNVFSSDEDDMRCSKKSRRSGETMSKEMSTRVWKPIRNVILQNIETSPEQVFNINRKNSDVNSFISTKQKEKKSNKDSVLSIVNLTKDNLKKFTMMDKSDRTYSEDRLLRYFNSTNSEPIQLNSSISETDNINISDCTINDIDRLQENASQELEIIRRCDELVSKIKVNPISNTKLNSEITAAINSTEKADSKEIQNIEQKSNAHLNRNIYKDKFHCSDISLNFSEVESISKICNNQSRLNLGKKNLERKEDSVNYQKPTEKTHMQKLNNNDEILYAKCVIENDNEFPKCKSNAEELLTEKVIKDKLIKDKLDGETERNNEAIAELIKSSHLQSFESLPQKIIQNQHLIDQNLEESVLPPGCENSMQILDRGFTSDHRHLEETEKSPMQTEHEDAIMDHLKTPIDCHVPQSNVQESKQQQLPLNIMNVDIPVNDNLNNSLLPTINSIEIKSNDKQTILVGDVIQDLEIPITQLEPKSNNSHDNPDLDVILETINKSLDIDNNASHTGIIKNIAVNTLNNQNLNHSLSYVFSLLHKEKNVSPNFVTKISPLPEISIRRIRWSIDCDSALESGVRHECYKTLNSFAMPICTAKNCTGGNLLFNFSAILNSGSLQIELNGQEAQRVMFGLSKDIWLDVCCLLYSLGQYHYHNGKLDRKSHPLQASILDLIIKSSPKIGNLMLLYQKVKSRNGFMLRSINASKSHDVWQNSKTLDVAKFGLKSKTLKLLQTSAKLHNEVVSQNKIVTMTCSNINVLQGTLDSLDESNIIQRNLLSEEVKKLQSDLDKHKKVLLKLIRAEEVYKKQFL